MATKAEQIAAAINKKLGDDTVVLGSTLLETAPISWLSTGSLGLDVHYGGGWVRNQFNEIVGPESSCKTAITLSAIAYHQAENPNFMVLWAAAEDLDPEWCQFLGVDLERMVVIQSNGMEEVFNICLQALEQQAFDLLVIDSLPALVPMDEEEKTMEEFTVGRGALLIGKFFRKATAALKKNHARPCTCVIINQWRDRIGVIRGDPRTTPGGKAKNYFFWTRTELNRVEWLSNGKTKIGLVTKAKTFKNKSAPVQREVEVDFYFDDGGPVPAGKFDRLKEVINIALAYEVIERRGAMYDFQGEPIAKGRDQLGALLYERPELAEKVRDAVMSRVRGVEAPAEPARKPVKRRRTA